MIDPSERHITIARLRDIPPGEIIAHMSDPRVARHMPLLTFQWDNDAVTRFVAAKEACWHRDGLGHWAMLCDDSYVGWGGFQSGRLIRMDPKLDETTLTAWARLVRAQQVLLEWVEVELKKAGLPPLRWYDVLLELHRAGSRGPAAVRDRRCRAVE